jgi:hypothetical protein
MSDLIKMKIKKDNTNYWDKSKRKSLVHILSIKRKVNKNNLQKNESSEQAKIINDNNSNFNIINIKEAIENKNLIMNKNKTLEKIYITVYGFLGFIIMMHVTHFIFCPNVSNKYNNFLVFNLPIYFFYTCFI